MTVAWSHLVSPRRVCDCFDSILRLMMWCIAIKWLAGSPVITIILHIGENVSEIYRNARQRFRVVWLLVVSIYLCILLGLLSYIAKGNTSCGSETPFVAIRRITPDMRLVPDRSIFRVYSSSENAYSNDVACDEMSADGTSVSNVSDHVC